MPANRPPSRGDSVAFAKELLAATSWFPSGPGDDTPDHFVVATGFLARCRALLSGITTLVENAEDDSVGALYRPLLETYLSGIYLLLGGEEAADTLHRAFQYQVHRLELALGHAKPEDRPQDAFYLPVSQRKQGTGLVERVDALMGQADASAGGWAPRIHDNHYRLTSLHDAHGGLGCLRGYVQTSSTERLRINPRRDEPRNAVFLLNMGLSLTLGFAGIWAMKIGRDNRDLRDLLHRWEAAQPAKWQEE